MPDHCIALQNWLFFMYICQNKFFPAKFLFKGCFYFYRKSFNMYYNRYAVLRSGNKCLKKDLVRRKVFLFCALRSTLQFTFFFLNILGKSLIFALDDIGEIDFWGRKWQKWRWAWKRWWPLHFFLGQWWWWRPLHHLLCSFNFLQQHDDDSVEDDFSSLKLHCSDNDDCD